MKPQKAKHLYLEEQKVKPAHVGHLYSVMEKLDGWYGYWDIGEPIMSRQMNAIRSLEWLSNELNCRTRGLPQGRLIFEILVEGQPVFKDLNGTLNAHAPARRAYLKVHDFIADGHLDMPFGYRYALAETVVTKLDHPVVSMIPVNIMSSHVPHWREYAEAVWARGGEGVIMKKSEAGYSPGKKHADILKIKCEKSEEMVVTGVHVGQGKYSETLGYLLVKDVHGVIHKVSGMTDSERDAWWSDPELIIGQVVEVQFMQRLANGSLREPRYKAVRHDKTVEELG